MVYYNLDYRVSQFVHRPMIGVSSFKRTQLSRFPTPEDENRPSFRNVVCFLEYQTMDKVQKLSSPDCK
jgi:hypothetical protein